MAVRKAKKRTAAKSKVKKGAGYVCGVCGLSVTVDEACGCAEAHPIICCMKPMKKKRSR
jgi:rubrerythrin